MARFTAVLRNAAKQASQAKPEPMSNDSTKYHLSPQVSKAPFVRYRVLTVSGLLEEVS